jgi:hypothetical protein
VVLTLKTDVISRLKKFRKPGIYRAFFLPTTMMYFDYFRDNSTSNELCRREK